VAVVEAAVLAAEAAAVVVVVVVFQAGVVTAAPRARPLCRVGH
jgi:hypothetical protein